MVSHATVARRKHIWNFMFMYFGMNWELGYVRYYVPVIIIGFQ
jgi:hypothetical protein